MKFQQAITFVGIKWWKSTTGCRREKKGMLCDSFLYAINIFVGKKFRNVERTQKLIVVYFEMTNIGEASYVTTVRVTKHCSKKL